MFVYFRMAVRLKAVDFRNLSLLSHLYSNLGPHMTLTSADPYTVPWKDVAIHICYMHVPREQIMYALNASVVALCHADLKQVMLTYTAFSGDITHLVNTELSTLPQGY